MKMEEMTGRREFRDHFSGHAADYAAFRPTYPKALIEWLAALSPQRGLAWDCGTGNGQAALLLADRFERVVATDASQEQLDRATPHPRIVYRVAREDASGIEPGSADLVTVAQALHWFDLPRFYAEVERVLRPDGALAAWCYARLRLEPDLEPVVGSFYSERVGRYWPAERRLVEEEYRGLPFPFEEIDTPEFALTASMDRREFLGYVSTWSATARARREEGRDPIPELEAALVPLWPDPAARRPITWPIGMRVGRRRASRGGV
jgi:SAM-dependent methyltransferase